MFPGNLLDRCKHSAKNRNLDLIALTGFSLFCASIEKAAIETLDKKMDLK